MFHFKSIQTRLIVAVVSLSTAIVLFFTVFSFLQINEGLKRKLQSEAAVMISPFHILISRDLPVKSSDMDLFVRVQVGAKGASLFPELVRVHSDLRGLMFLEPDGKILRSEGPEVSLSPIVLHSIAIGEETVEKLEDNSILVSVPFHFKGRNLGSSILVFTQERFLVQEQRIVKTAVLGFVLFLVTGTIAATFVARNIVGPIVRLAEHIKQRDSSEIDDYMLNRNDELGTLSRRLSQMQDAVDRKMDELNKEISRREQIETELRLTNERSIVQQEVISHLSVEESLRVADFNSAASIITEMTAKALDVHRVSLWLLDEENNLIHCLDLYDSSREICHSSGDILRIEDFPIYFEEIKNSDALAATDVHTDRRTVELAENYFHPNNIVSTIDVGLNVDGKIYGVICCESIGVRRPWKPDEIIFVSRIADQASLALATSKRIQAERARRQSEEDMRITLNSIGDGVIATDSEGHITRMNPVAEALTRWNRDKALGRPLSEVLLIEDFLANGPSSNLIDNLIELEYTGDINKNSVLKARDGTEKIIAKNGAPIRNDKDEVVGLVIVFRDVTKQVELEQQFQQAEKMQAIGQLAGGVAHDFNNMLAGILGAAELLSFRLEEDKKSRELVRIIFQASHSAADLVNKLLAFSRKGKTLTQVIDAASIIDDAVAILKRSIDKRISLISEITAENSCIIGDPSLLQNAVLNLALNARDSLPEGGEVIIKTENVELDESYCASNSFNITPGEYLMITVQDNGIGMSSSVQQRIFEPFFTTKSQGDGTGLGLSAVYGTVSEHNGAINVYSEVGKGTTFNLYLPSCTEAGDHKPVKEIDAMNGSGTILVIDDEEIVRETASALLEKLGYHVLVAASGEQGIKLYSENEEIIGGVLLDMIMPSMSGKEVFRAIRQINNKAKIIIASGFSHDDSIVLLQKEGLAAFLKKPFTLAMLNKVFHEVMAEKSE